MCVHTHTYCHTAAPKDEVDCRYTKRRPPSSSSSSTPEKMSRTKQKSTLKKLVLKSETLVPKSLLQLQAPMAVCVFGRH